MLLKKPRFLAGVLLALIKLIFSCFLPLGTPLNGK